MNLNNALKIKKIKWNEEEKTKNTYTYKDIYLSFVILFQIIIFEFMLNKHIFYWLFLLLNI